MAASWSAPAGAAGLAGEHPFAGLGFDLAPVVARASVVSLRLLALGDGVVPAVRVHGYAPAGYELLLRLGREIRGR